MASTLTASTEHLRAVASANSYFTGINLSLQGNIQAQTGAEDVRSAYNQLTFPVVPIDPSVIPTINTVGMFGAFDAVIQVAAGQGDADFEVRRNTTLQYSDGRLQVPISTLFGNTIEAPNDSRWVIYYPTEDGRVGAFAHIYETTDPNDVAGGNNIAELLELTKRIPNFNGTSGPINLNGTANVDLYSQNGIFAKGCLVTWESPGIGNDAVLVGPGV